MYIQNRSQQNQQKENEQFNEKTQRNPNKIIFQKQRDSLSPRRVLNPSGQTFSQSNNTALINQNQGSMKSQAQVNAQNQQKSSSVTSRRKIFSKDEDTQSVSSQQANKQQNQARVNHQMIQQQDQQNLECSSINVQNNNRRLSYQNDNSKQQYNSLERNQQLFSPQQNNIQKMYHELLEQFNQLQQGKQATEQTHSLEIEDTKKHYEYKIQESQKKIQELVAKLQNQQQNFIQIQNQLKNLQEEVSNKDLEVRKVLSQKEQTNTYQDDILKLKQQKIHLEKVISDGKLYIEKIKLESDLKSQEIIKLKEEFQQLQIVLNTQEQKVLSTNNTCNTMHSEIQQLIASNLELQRIVEFERKDKEQKILMLNRTNQNNPIKILEDEKERRLLDLENNLKNIIEKSNQMNIDIKQKQVQIEKLQTMLKQNGINSQQDMNIPKEKQKKKNYQGLCQITEEQNEDSFLEMSKRLKTDMSQNNAEELRSYSKCLLEEIENLKSQLNATQQKIILLSKENDSLRTTSQLAVQNPSMVNGSSTTFLDRIKELNNTISNLQKDKETLIYENTIITNQLKKEKQSREDEVKIYQNQIKNYQQVQNISTNNQISQFTSSLPQFSESFKTSIFSASQYQGNIQSYTEPRKQQSHPQLVEQLTYSNPSLQQNNYNLTQIQQQPYSNLVQPSKVTSSVSSLYVKPPIGLTKQSSLQDQSQVSSIINSQTLSESIMNPSITQGLDQKSGLITQNQVNTFKREISHDYLTSSNINTNIGLEQISTSFTPYKFDQKDENQFYSHRSKGILEQISPIDNVKQQNTIEDSHYQSLILPYSRNLTELNNKVINSTSLSIPSSSSYAIVRPGEYIPTIQQAPTSIIKSGDFNPVNQQQPKQAQVNPAQNSLVEIGDMLLKPYVSDSSENIQLKQTELNLNTGIQSLVLSQQQTDTYNSKNPYII